MSTRGREQRTVVVGVDGSDHARMALKWAGDEAHRRGASLRILLAEISPPENVPSWYHGDDGTISPSQAIIDDAYALAVMRHPDVVVLAEVVEWPPALVLTVASRKADLLVIGARGKGGFGELLLGSVSDQCIQYSHCPVAVISEDPDGGPARHGDPRIVVGVDGSFGSSEALRWALSEAILRSASVEAIHAWQFPAIGAFVLGPPRGFEAAGQEIIDGATDTWSRWAPEVSFSARSDRSDPVTSLVEAARGAELLVLGSKGHGGFVHALLGSVAHQCARHVRGAVVVTQPTATMGAGPAGETAIAVRPDDVDSPVS